jgi:hypothetical protein
MKLSGWFFCSVRHGGLRNYRLFLARFLVFAPFLAVFDFFAVFLWEAVFVFLLPFDNALLLADFAFDRPSDVVALATDLSAFTGVPLRISSPIVSAVLATGRLPRADCSPTIVPATPPAIAPTGPPTIAPSTAPVTPPTACLLIETFLSVVAFDADRVALFFLDVLAIITSVYCAELVQPHKMFETNDVPTFTC